MASVHRSQLTIAEPLTLRSSTGSCGNNSLFICSARTSAAQTEASDQASVALNIIVLHVGEKALAAADELHEAPAGVVISLVELQMLGQPVDTAREQGDLDLWRAGVGLVKFVLGDCLCLRWHAKGEVSSPSQARLPA